MGLTSVARVAPGMPEAGLQASATKSPRGERNKNQAAGSSRFSSLARRSTRLGASVWRAGSAGELHIVLIPNWGIQPGLNYLELDVSFESVADAVEGMVEAAGQTLHSNCCG